MRAGSFRKPYLRAVIQSVGLGSENLAFVITIAALFVILWLDAGWEKASSYALVISALFLATRVVIGVCTILNDARKWEIERRNAVITMLGSGILMIAFFTLNLPTVTIIKLALGIGIIIFLLVHLSLTWNTR